MPRPYHPKPDGIFFDPNEGRLMEHHGCSKRIYWTKDMLDYLRRHFATMLNEELAGCIGVSPRTMIRKARELGLQKDPAWLAAVWEERRKLARAISRQKGYPGGFEKGRHVNPDGEFQPGHRLTPEQDARRRESLRRWYRQHPDLARAKAAKGWETRKERKPLTPEGELP